MWEGDGVGRNHNRAMDSTGAYSGSTKLRQLRSHHLAAICSTVYAEPSRLHLTAGQPIAHRAREHKLTSQDNKSVSSIPG
ncbi:hypothetical protein PoB_000236100 [Plakobranchus ocellatus]|uniref:Uncharacterized protein n=1 Tax=Plakobranchus ocellatus TaxID=259542 RepID=A0AAV3XYF4_9GAST|nr:hypothetical protein PoB_000236100 [Plakobranchus ocellatus]